MPGLLADNNVEGQVKLLLQIIRNFNTPVSLPVITLADPKRILESGDYAERVVERILEYLIDLESYRGTGRWFVP